MHSDPKCPHRTSGYQPHFPWESIVAARIQQCPCTLPSACSLDLPKGQAYFGNDWNHLHLGMEDLHIQHHNLPTTTNRVLSTGRQTTIPTRLTNKTQHCSRNIPYIHRENKKEIIKIKGKGGLQEVAESCTFVLQSQTPSPFQGSAWKIGSDKNQLITKMGSQKSANHWY